LGQHRPRLALVAGPDPFVGPRGGDQPRKLLAVLVAEDVDALGHAAAPSGSPGHERAPRLPSPATISSPASTGQRQMTRPAHDEHHGPGEALAASVRSSSTVAHPAVREQTRLTAFRHDRHHGRPMRNSPTEDSTAQSSPSSRADRSASPLPSPHGARPIAVATR